MLEVPTPPSNLAPNLVQPKAKGWSGNQIRLIILTNILTAAIVGGIFYIGNVPSYKALEYASKIQENNALRNTNLPPPTKYVYVEELSPVSTVITDFPPSKYVIWTENSATYTLVGAEYGKFKVGDVPYNSQYKKGDEIYAVQLNMKLFSEKTDCVSIPKLRLVNLHNDFMAPLERQFVFANGGCGSQAFTTYTDKKLTYITSSQDSEFNFTYQKSSQLGNFKLKVVNNSIVLE